MNEIALVIGEDHYNTLGLVRSLGEGNLPVHLIVKSNNSKSFVSKSKYIFKYWVKSDINEIVELLNGEYFVDRKVIVFCSSDQIVNELDRFRGVLIHDIVLPKISMKLGGFDNLTNKTFVTTLADEHGITVPQSWRVSREELESFEKNILNNISFKCIVKPAKSEFGVKDDIRICCNQEEISKELRDLFTRMDVVQVQEFIDKDIEINLLGAALNNGDVIIPGIMYKLKHNKNHYEFYSEIREIDNSKRELVNLISSFVKKIEYQGLFGVELMVVRNKFYFLEINLRNDANSYSITNGGVNLPLIYFISCVNGNITKQNLVLRNKCNYVNEIAYFKYLFETKFEFFEFFKIILKADCFMYFNKKDIKPFIYKYLKFF
ncbi:Predicted ATP-dependent carboligase, ATP-grasp superfamily [Myroides marinus]|uniref:Predicted ATP-dependent carboligase, ATP-grasp superfamily n=1 Tax=Myroides marinus TaxID=703342 RepID=A0A1H6XJ98_9FLAO|nr:ATP-grasp domain-containing protein [Myroides marinus]SEJ29178.1 Predicted ATP-dependent carboligase, ATP-grasp superfamily [Myroides marinus]